MTQPGLEGSLPQLQQSADSEGNKEVQPHNPTIVLFIDDDWSTCGTWTRAFSNIDWQVISPGVTAQFRFESQEEAHKRIEDFVAGLTDDLLSKVNVVFADQFNDDLSLVPICKELIQRIRALNPGCFIIEISAAVTGKYYNGDAILDDKECEALKEKVTSIKGLLESARLGAFKRYTDSALIEAAFFDSNGRASDEAFDNRAALSLNRIKLRPEFKVLCDELLQRDMSGLVSTARGLNREKLGLFLHYSWTIVNLLTEGHGPEFYAMALRNLKVLLGMENAV